MWPARCAAIVVALTSCNVMLELDKFDRAATSSATTGGASTSSGGGATSEDCTGEAEFRSATRCYWLSSGVEAEWSIARDTCLALGATWDLAATSTAEEHAVVVSGIQNLYAGDTWTGGNDEGQEGVFSWINGEPWTFELWESSQPDNGGNCVELDAEAGEIGGYDDCPCDSDRSFVCERPL